MNNLELLTLEAEKDDLQCKLTQVERKIKDEEERRAEEERRRRTDPLIGKEMYVKVRVIEKVGETAHAVLAPSGYGPKAIKIRVNDNELLDKLPYRDPQFNPFFHTW